MSTATDIDMSLFEDIVQDFEKMYQILILDDEINTMEFVTMVFMTHFELDEETALTKMFEVHESGQSILDAGSYDAMEKHHKAMMGFKLRSKIESIS